LIERPNEAYGQLGRVVGRETLSGREKRGGVPFAQRVAIEKRKSGTDLTVFSIGEKKETFKISLSESH